jgi:hypothetical protein
MQDVVPPDCPDQFNSVHPRHVDVDQQYVGRGDFELAIGAPQDIERLDAIDGAHQRIQDLSGLESAFDGSGVAIIIIDQQNIDRSGLIGGRYVHL